jgi:hypothetical protein
MRWQIILELHFVHQLYTDSTILVRTVPCIIWDGHWSGELFSKFIICQTTKTKRLRWAV